MVMDAAEQAMIELGYQIDRRDTVIGVLTSHPVELTGADAERGGRRLGTENNQRSVAEVRVSRAGDSVNVFCKVVIEEQTTQTYRFFQQQYGDDHADETAIDRDAGTTAKQNSVWSTVRRDRAAERAILAAVSERTDHNVTAP